MIRALYSAASGMNGAAIERRQHRATIGELEHGRVQSSACPISGLGVPKHDNSREHLQVRRPPCRSVCRLAWVRGPCRTRLSLLKAPWSKPTTRWMSRSGERFLSDPAGTTGELAYTRAGTFQMDRTGTIVTAEGEACRTTNHRSSERDERHDRTGRHG